MCCNFFLGGGGILDRLIILFYFFCFYIVGIWVDDVKVFIVVSGLRIIVCDDFEEVVEMVRVFIFVIMVI